MFTPEQQQQILGYNQNLMAGDTGQSQMGLGMNIPTFQLGLGAVNSLGNLWQSWGASKLAKKQFNFQSQMANTNLNNSIKSYNTSLTDRANTRAVMEGRSPDSARQYIEQHSMSR